MLSEDAITEMYADTLLARAKLRPGSPMDEPLYWRADALAKVLGISQVDHAQNTCGADALHRILERQEG